MAKFYKKLREIDCFLVPQRDLRWFYAGAVGPKSALFRGTHPNPLKNENFNIMGKIADFLQNKRCFLIAPRDLHFWGASGEYF